MRTLSKQGQVTTIAGAGKVVFHQPACLTAWGYDSWATNNYDVTLQNSYIEIISALAHGTVARLINPVDGKPWSSGSAMYIDVDGNLLVWSEAV